MERSSKCVAFFDILGMHNNLVAGAAELAERKLTKLVELTQQSLCNAHFVKGSNFSDTFALYTEDPGYIWELCYITIDIFKSYWELNISEDIKSPAAAYMTRGGVSFGDITEVDVDAHNFRAFYGIGDGLVGAYTCSKQGRGFRIFFDSKARSLLGKHNAPPEYEGIHVKLHKEHATDGSIRSFEILWFHGTDNISDYLNKAHTLFRRSLIDWKKGTGSDDVVEHYRETLRVMLLSCRNIEMLLPYLTYRINAGIYHEFLSPIWNTAWLSILDIDNWPVLEQHWERIWNCYLAICQTKYVGDLFQFLSRYNRLKPLLRFLRKGRFKLPKVGKGRTAPNKE